MTYRKFHRHANNRRPESRTIVVKYAGKCAGCGAEIKAGESAVYQPAYGRAGCDDSACCGHLGRKASVCRLDAFRELRAQAAVNDYAGDGLDERWEDDCARRCGL
jgi:hypothetical protein